MIEKKKNFVHEAPAESGTQAATRGDLQQPPLAVCTHARTAQPAQEKERPPRETSTHTSTWTKGAPTQGDFYLELREHTHRRT